MSAQAPQAQAAEPGAFVAATPATAFALVWALELALARITGQVQAWADILASALLLVVVPSLLLALLPRLPVSLQARRSLAGLVASLPLAAVVAGIVLPVAARHAGAGVTAALALLIAGLPVTTVLGARAGDGPAPSAGLTLGVVVAAAATAWVLLPAGFPPFQIHLPFLVVAVLLARLAVRDNGLPLVAMGGIAFALWPTLTPVPPWQGPGTKVDRPDVVLLSVQGPGPEAVAGMDAFARLAAAGKQAAVQAADSPAALLAEVLAVPDPGAPAPDARASLAARLAAEGYDTAAVVGAAPQLDVEQGFHSGFAAFHHFVDRNRYALPRWRALLADDEVRDYRSHPVAGDLVAWLGLATPPPFGSPRDILGVAAQIMAARREAPVFLWIHFDGDAAEIDARAGDVLDGLEKDADRPRRIVLLGVGAAGQPLESVPLAVGHFRIEPAPQLDPAHDAAAVTRLLLGPPAPAQPSAPLARSAAMRASS